MIGGPFALSTGSVEICEGVVHRVLQGVRGALDGCLAGLVDGSEKRSVFDEVFGHFQMPPAVRVVQGGVAVAIGALDGRPGPVQCFHDVHVALEGCTVKGCATKFVHRLHSCTHFDQMFYYFRVAISCS